MLKRKKILSLFLALILMLVLLFACATAPPTKIDASDPLLQTPFAKEAYRLLAAEVEIYNAAWLAFKDLHNAGLVADPVFEEGKDLARRFYKNYIKAVDLVIAYEKGSASQGEAKSAVDLVLTANKALQEYLKTMIPKKT